MRHRPGAVGAGLTDSQPLWNPLTLPHVKAGELGSQGLTYQFQGKYVSPAESPTVGLEGRACLWGRVQSVHLLSRL